jgi:hypothetical protein
MSKNVHSEEEWDILSDPEETPENQDRDDSVINDQNEIKISVKEDNNTQDILKIEIILDRIEKEAEELEQRGSKSYNKSIEQKNLIFEDDELCMCLAPYFNANSFKTLNCKINNCIIL